MVEKDWKIVGKDAIENRRWISLCPAYPHLKGVTCEDIEDFLKPLPPQVAKEQWWFEKVIDFKNRYDSAYQTYQPRDEKYPHTPDISFWYSREGAGAVITGEFKQFLRDTLPEDLAEHIISQSNGLPDLYQWATHIDKEWNQAELTWLELPSREFAEEYIRNIKVYDRDEMFEAMKRAGDELAGRIWDGLTEYDRKRFLFTHHLSKKPTLTFEEYNEKDREYIKRNVLNNTGTIYVTSPRGGHEMLSIFAYANNIKKDQIPSDIVIKEPAMPALFTEGETWLGDGSDINAIVFVDDIVASGEQLKKFVKTVEKKNLKRVPLTAIHLCSRETPTQLENEDQYNKDAIELHSEGIFDVETIGIRDAKTQFLTNHDRKIEGTITCMFPHACPDGDSDWLLQRLYGSPRCSPERRIGRRDL